MCYDFMKISPERVFPGILTLFFQEPNMMDSFRAHIRTFSAPNLLTIYRTTLHDKNTKN